MSMQEQYFPEMSRYPKKSPTATSMEAQEAWLNRFPHKRAENRPNGGIIRSIADTSHYFTTDMTKSERKAARIKAQREHRQALKALAKQDEQDAKEIKKQLSEWQARSNKEEQERAREESRIKRNAAKRAERAAAKAKRLKKEMATKAGQEVLNALKEHGIYQVSDFELSRKYLKNIIYEVRGLGYTVNVILENRSIVAYRMDKQ